MSRLFYLLVFLPVIATSCIGTDEEDAPIVGESIELDRQQLSLLVGDSAEVNATFFNRYGVEEEAEISWISSNEAVASVNSSGVISGQGSGQSNLTAIVGSTESETLLVTVVEDENSVAQVTITSPVGTRISVGQEVELEIGVFNILGEQLTGLDISYTALDPQFLSVDQNGTATGVATGFGRIVATVEGVDSNTLGIQVGQTSRTGSFNGANGYDASGTTELFLAENGGLMLRLNSDFDTDFALGTFIYLSNSTSGSVTRNEGLEIQEVTTGGEHLFNVSSLDSEVGISDFQYVVVLCKPATITFGYAQLN
jgi:hypothetical protein